MLLSSETRRNYVLDTSVLAYHGESIHSFPGQNVYIPIEVLEEVDNLKTRKDKVGASCRYINRYLDKVREMGSLASGIEIEDEQFLFVISSKDLNIKLNDLADTVDNRIISYAANLIQEGKDAVVVSRDIAIRVRCDSLGIPAINYDKDSRDNTDFFYNGVEEIEVFDYDINSFYDKGFLSISDVDLYPNQGVILKSGRKSALAIADGKGCVEQLSFANQREFCVEGIRPRTAEQVFAFELLLDPNIHMVSLTGMAGSGKTILAVAAALHMLHNNTYNKLILARPAQSTSKDIGFLPGDKREKVMPWLQPIFDNLSVILGEKGKSYINLMLDRGIIEMEALAYVRGRTLPNTIFIVDEAQNITHHEAKALLTRMGENSKIILIGDIEQIDSPSLDQRTSGLSSVVSLFKEFEHSGHIRLKKGERSKLATFAAKVM